MSNKRFEVYVRICDKCENPFSTFVKRCKICPNCFRGQIWKMEITYPKEDVEKKLSTIKFSVSDDNFINKNNVKLEEDRR